MVSCLGTLSFREMAGKWRMVTDLSIYFPAPIGLLRGKLGGLAWVEVRR